MPHVVGSPDQLGLRCADRCTDADTTDAQWIVMALEGQRPLAAANAYNESRFGNYDAN
jgi:hypothetical protein